MNQTALLVGIAMVALIGVTSLFLTSARDGISALDQYTAPGLEPLTVSEAKEGHRRLTSALLLGVYNAFLEEDESAIYDTLGRVTAGDALEYLYLERVGTMAVGDVREPDQTIHQIELLDTHLAQNDARLAVDASWEIIATVGHDDHLHVRGNTYRANLSIAPIDGAWKITSLELLEVIRDTVGGSFVVPDDTE